MKKQSRKSEAADVIRELEWKDPPPKIVGRKPMDRPDAIESGKRIRARLEADRRARGIPVYGVVFEGEKQDRPPLKKKGSRGTD